MTDSNLVQLMTLLSPVFPIGGFAYSAGLESACQHKLVTDEAQLQAWIETGLTRGALRNDGIILSNTAAAATAAAAAAAAASATAAGTLPDAAPGIDEINDLALGLCGSATRFAETTAMGAAFIESAIPWLAEGALPLPSPLSYPVAVGAVTGAAFPELPVRSTLTAYFQAAISQQVQSALRLIPLGQRAGVRLQHRFEPLIATCAEQASRSTLDALGSSSLTMDIVAMQHSTLTSRIFRS